MDVLQPFLEKLPSRQLLRYLFVGAWNTLFGYSLFALLTYVLTDQVQYAYMVASPLSHVINVTVAFLSYKHFVFRAEGSLLRQYLRCHIVYGSAFVVNFALLPIFVGGLQLIVGSQRYVPYVVGGVLTLFTVSVSFLAHKHFSFATQRSKDAVAPALTGSTAIVAQTNIVRVD
jgi:putative flippase GtrA